MAAEEKNNKFGTHWGPTGGKESFVLQFKRKVKYKKVSTISLDEVVLERGLHISDDQFYKSFIRLKTKLPWNRGKNN